MNGWRRLFVGISVLVCAPAVVLAIGSWPSGDKSHYASGCAQGTYFTEAEAAQALEAGSWVQDAYYTRHKCPEELAKISSGAALRDDRLTWRRNIQAGAIGVTVFLAALYAVGWGIGWIWRGFFPPKSTR